MKVLYFHQHFVTPRGAGAIRSYAMSQKLIKRGHEVTLVCGSAVGGSTGLTEPFDKRGRRRGVVEGINVIEINLPYSNKDSFTKRVLTFLKYVFFSIEIIFKEKYDLIFCTSTPLTAGIPGVLSHWILRKPFVFEVRDLWPELPKAMKVITNPVLLWMMGLLEWVCYHSATRLVALSPGIADGIAKRGIPTNLIELIPNGCDIDIFGVKYPAWRPDCISEDDFMAIFAGTHGIANGLDSVIDAAIVLKKRKRSDIKILLIGDGRLKKELISRAKEENLDNIIFHDVVSKSLLAGLMASADIGLQVLSNIPAFYYGTSPNKFFDYIAAGLPVINNYPGWIADMIKEENIGFAVLPDSAEQFADAFELAADNSERLKEQGLAARNLANKRFDRNLLSDKWCEWVEGAIL